MSCPHCQFLIAYPVRQHALPGKCPRCGQLLENTEAIADEPVPDHLGISSYLYARQPVVEEDIPAMAQDAPPSSPPDSAPAVAHAAAPLAVAGATADADMFVDTAAAAVGATAGNSETDPLPATPRFAHPSTATTALPRGGRLQWLLVALLIGVLLLQIVLADRKRLAADPRWRPLVAGMCNLLGCTVPAWHEPEAFTMLSRDVRPVPDAPGLLQVHASFRNDAQWAQSWPILQLSLSDADGRTTGTRAFLPTEYLKGTAAHELLAPGQSAQVAFQVREPAATTVAFTFDFH